MKGKIVSLFIGFVFLVFGVCFLGPRPDSPDLDPKIVPVQCGILELEAMLEDKHVMTSELYSKRYSLCDPGNLKISGRSGRSDTRERMSF